MNMKSLKKCWSTAQLKHIRASFIGERHRLEVELEHTFEQIRFEAVGTLLFEESALGLVHVVSKERLYCTYEYK